METIKELLDILICPKCRQKLNYIENEKFLTCNKCSLKYKIDASIPLLLIDSALSFKDTDNDSN